MAYNEKSHQATAKLASSYQESAPQDCIPFAMCVTKRVSPRETPDEFPCKILTHESIAESFVFTNISLEAWTYRPPSGLSWERSESSDDDVSSATCPSL